jgi:hypothetical protein
MGRTSRPSALAVLRLMTSWQVSGLRALAGRAKILLLYPQPPMPVADHFDTQPTLSLGREVPDRGADARMHVREQQLEEKA